MNKIIDIHLSFDEYLARVNCQLPENTIQYIEMKRAFVAGIAQTMIILRDVEGSDYEIAIGLDRIMEDIQDFWSEEVKKFKGGLESN
jgi:hypothetical protein